MILKIRNSAIGKAMSLFMVFVFFLTLNPIGSYALTGGAAQPEFNSFTPIGTSDMVDLASGDFSYNIPIMDVGGFPINLAYNSGVNMDQEASWVGLGWDLSIGQINRQMRGLPDDFDGDEMVYENNVKDNWTVGGTFQFSPELFGFSVDKDSKGKNDTTFNHPINLGVSGQYNSYAGYSFTPSLGVSYDMGGGASVGFNASSSPDGLVLSPNVSLSNKHKEKKDRDLVLTGTAGVSFNSRQGITNFNLSASAIKSTNKVAKKMKNTKIGGASLGSSVSFVPNTYTPTVQSNMTSLSGTFNTAVSTTLFGTKGEAEITGFVSNQFVFNKVDERKSYGYEHTERAPLDGILDFNREKDGVFSVNSTNLPLTNYTYDIYSVQGQGVSGMFHPYRSQVGYVYDNEMKSTSGGISGGGELGGGGTADVGLDIEATVTNVSAGLWENRNEALNSFEEKPGEKAYYEEVYFKNVGDLSVDREDEIYESALGGYTPIRFKVGDIAYARNLKNKYMRKGEYDIDVTGSTPYPFDPIAGTAIDQDAIKRKKRVRRNQNIQKITIEESLYLDEIETAPIASGAKAHHTAGFIVTRNDGARYNYGKALYHKTKKEVSFALGDEVGASITAASGTVGNNYTGLVNYGTGDNSLDNKKGDHYFNSITTPAYGHTFLLTSLVSTDYSDRDDTLGPSTGDFGSYTMFEYRDMGDYKWRVPFASNQANFNEGLRTDPTDDKGSYVYGEKQTSYIQKIETKTHVAIFHISPRKDGFGVAGEDGGIGLDSKMYQLDKVTLYSRGEYYGENVERDVDVNQNIIFTGSDIPTPIKTAHFVYNNELCKGIPNYSYSEAPSSTNGGKSTLKAVYFTYRDSKMGKFSPYEFTYGDSDHNPDTAPDRNPDYDLKGYDIWGCAKTHENPDAIIGKQGDKTLDPLALPEFNYVEQNTVADADRANKDAAAWSITDIKLPSGGKIQIDYEADDYNAVQNKKTMRMFKLAGAGDQKNPDSSGDSKFVFDPNKKDALLYRGIEEVNYLYFELDKEDQGALPDLNEFREKYLKELYDNQKGLLQFRMFMNMSSKGGKKSGTAWESEPFDYVSGYAELHDDMTNSEVFKFSGNGINYGSIALKRVELESPLFNAIAESGIGAPKVNPFSKAGWQYGRRYLGKYVYGMPLLDEGVAVGAALEAVYGAFENMAEAALGPNTVLRSKKIARKFITDKSWIRLSEPTKHKIGGGCRVQKIVMTDEWAGMIGEPEDGIMDQEYGQEYSYTLLDGASSGVATYEPLGSKENPFVQPVFVNTKRLLAPDDQNYMEKPFGESFFPNPTVTYSRVTVKNLERTKNFDDSDDSNDLVVGKHATGEVITEFFTSKDYPTIADQTHLRVEEDHNPLLSSLFSINVVKHLTLSQGYSIHLNDMNGKMKSQRVYAEGQDGAISGVDYKYDLNAAETVSQQFGNKGKLDNKVWAMEADGKVREHTLGLEQNIINDFREMKTDVKVVGVDLQTNTFPIGPLVLVVPTWFPKVSRNVTKLNIATTTKVINTFGVLREVVAHDAGASVSTRNKLWDAETGEVLITETVNEFDDNYYSFNFPAHWHYDRMGQAAFNSGLVLKIAKVSGSDAYNFETFSVDGDAQQYLKLGDEVLATSKYYFGDDLVVQTKRAWVTKLEEGGSKFHLMAENGEDLTLSAGSNLKLKVIRSGNRNVQSTSMGSIVLQADPMDLFIPDGVGFQFDTEALIVNETSATDWKENKIVNAGAVEFRENWDLQCECGIDEENNSYNPYVYNTLGVWRANRSHLYLTGRKHRNGTPSPREDGFYSGFSSFYKLKTDGTWEIDSTNWTFTSEVTQFSPYGFELENADALERNSAAQYGYNFSFPLAVGANAGYNEMGFDGFEDYNFTGCEENEHFGFKQAVENGDGNLTKAKSHTGKFSLQVNARERVVKGFKVNCK